jgi:hypothetical protein
MPASRLLAVDVAVEFVAAALRAGALAVAFLCALRDAVKKPICLVFCTFFGQGKCLAMTESSLTELLIEKRFQSDFWG